MPNRKERPNQSEIWLTKLDVMFIFLAISPLFEDRFGRSLQFLHIEFDREAISDACRSGNARYRWGVLNFNYFSELSFCGPCGACFYKHSTGTV